MTTHTRHRVLCPCGHIDNIKMNENNQSYSKQWGKYTLENLIREDDYCINGVADLRKVFCELKPCCLKYDTSLTEANLI